MREPATLSEPPEGRSRPCFQTAAPQVVGLLRASIAQMFQSMGVEVDNHARVASALGISKTLAWKLTRVLQEPDPMSALTQMPGAEAFETLIKKAKAKGISQPAIEALRRSMQELISLEERYAGSRAGLELLAAGCSTDQDSSIAINHRKAAFTGNSFIWGVQAAVGHRIGFLRESLTTPGRTELAVVGVTHGLRKTRPNSSWLVARNRVMRDHPDNASPNLTRLVQEPLDTEVDPDGPSLIRRFCTNPLPPLKTVRTAEGMKETRLEPGGVGDTGAVTITIGNITRNAPLYKTASDEAAGFINRMRTPTELHVSDFFVQAGLLPQTRPTVRLASDLGYPEFTGVEEHRLLSIPMQVNLLGRGTACVTSSSLPWAGELSDWVFQRLGWDPMEFELYRTELRYPPIATSVQMAVPLR